MTGNICVIYTYIFKDPATIIYSNKLYLTLRFIGRKLEFEYITANSVFKVEAFYIQYVFKIKISDNCYEYNINLWSAT